MNDTATATPVSHPPSPSGPSLPSLPSQQLKLTKKQKKAIAFRRDKSKSSTSKRKAHKDDDGDDDEQGIDQMEDLHGALMEKSSQTSGTGSTNQMAAVEEERGGSAAARNQKAGAGEEGAHHVTVWPQQKRGQKHQGIGKEGYRQSDGNGKKRDEKANGGKRKREDNDNGTAEKKGSDKKRKREKDEFGVDDSEEEGEGEGEEIGEGEGEGKKKKGKDNARFILFIGNLKYTTSVDTIKAHFSDCDPPPQVRLLTPKSSSTGKTSNKSKGCAFLEFTHRNGLQQALKLHNSNLDGRMINVELTAGGGGKSDKRMEKLRERNKALLGQRQNKNSKDGSLPSKSSKPQRYSTTSGMEQSSRDTQRTWTVGDVIEDEPHRGGKKHKKGERTRGSRTKSKAWGTGVNAIPVS